MRSFSSFALLAVAACSSGGGGAQPDAGQPAGDSAVVSCSNDARVTPYAANLEKTSAMGTFKVTLVRADPAPPARDLNTWTIRSTSTAPLKVETYMPDHGHMSTVKPTMTQEQDGSYKVEHLDFFMGGVWRIRFSTASDAGPGDTADFFFCIEG